MMRSLILLTFIFLTAKVSAQKTENVILITLDGLRWQEVFSGADSLLVDDSGYVEDPESLVNEFWHNDPLIRRQKLMPFFWTTIAIDGQLYGNRKYGSKVNCSNQLLFSYPGYNEILTGEADDVRITSNDKVNNPNVTVLEYLNQQDSFEGKVSAFGSWDVFPYIINEERSGVPVNAGFETVTSNPTEIEEFLNKIQGEIRGPWGTVRLDVFTHHFAMEELKKNKPRMMYIAYGETDDYAHDGAYDQYLKSALQTDKYIKEIWDFIQTDPQYSNKTTMIITTDHGRGTNPKSTWRSHGSSIDNSNEIWIVAIGPDTPALGEVKNEMQLYQNQIASTVVRAFGFDYPNEKAGLPITDVFQK